MNIYIFTAKTFYFWSEHLVFCKNIRFPVKAFSFSISRCFFPNAITQINPPILHVQMFYFPYPNIQGPFSAGRLDWRRNISLRGPVFVSRGNKRFLIYGGTIHSTIREVSNKCQTLLRKCYDLIPPLLSAFSPSSSSPHPIQKILLPWKFHFLPNQIVCTFVTGEYFLLPALREP